MASCSMKYNLARQWRRTNMRELAKRLWSDESGQGLAEYALLLGLIVIGVVVLIQGMGISIQKIFTKANADLGTAATGLP
jgi:pilus assembly protein Flp/PilA